MEDRRIRKLKRKSRLIKSKGAGRRRYNGKAFFMQIAVSIAIASVIVYKMNKSSNISLFLQNLQLYVLALMTTVIIAIFFLIIFLKGEEGKDERTKGPDKK